MPDYIVFLTDGEANIGSVYGANDPTYPQGNADDQQPCHTAINVANQYKAAGTTIYSIGYALGNNVECTAGAFHMSNAQNNWVACTLPTAGCYHYASNTNESPAITSFHTLSQIASPGNFYNQPNAGAAEHDLRRHRDRHRPGLEPVGGRWLLSCDAGWVATTARHSRSSASLSASCA